MWTSRYWYSRYWTSRYWTRNGTAIEQCVYVPGPRVRFGVGIKFGTCRKFGDGYSDPWFPEIGADIAEDPRFTIESGGDVLDRNDDTLLQVDSRNELSVEYGGVANEVFILEAPDENLWQVTIDGNTGAITVEGGADTELVTGDNLQLAFLEADLPWEPGLPLSPGALDEPDQRQLLWGYPFQEGAGSSVTGTPVKKRIVSYDGELFDLSILNTGELQFTNAFETHTSDSAFTPTYTEE